MALPETYPQHPQPERERYTEDEYYAWEDRSPERWEWVPYGPPDSQGRRLGLIRAMSGGIPDHSGISINLGVALTNGLRAAGKRTCRVFNSDLKVHSPNGVNTYPDLSVVCGPLTYHRKRRDTITNPILIAEVLSPSTQAYDRGAKRNTYQAIPTLQHFLLISADRVHIEVYTRGEFGWTSEVWESPSDHLALPALGITIEVADVYDLVEFEGGTG